MHAVAVKATINDLEAAVANLEARVIPGVKQAPGFVAAYWTRSNGDDGLALIVFEAEQGAQAAKAMVEANVDDQVTLESVEVREVVASALAPAQGQKEPSTTEHPQLRAAPGDRLVVSGHHQGEHERDGEVLEVHGEGGGPPFLVRWEDGTTTVLYPGSDVAIQHFPKSES
jgi:hypothetical protein